jgi:RHS repeat-associated protein
MVKGGVTYRMLSDHLGSVRLVVNADTGAIAQRIDYDEWGDPSYVTGPPDFQPFGFAGGLTDRDTGLVRFGARDYDPRVGRWTSKDPIGFDGGLNLFGYALNDPVSFVDSNGLAVVRNRTGRPLSASGNAGLGSGAGPQVPFTIPPGATAGGSENPVPNPNDPSCPITDVDFVDGVKLFGDDSSPVLDLYEFDASGAGGPTFLVPIPDFSGDGAVRSLLRMLGNEAQDRLGF